MGYTHYFFNLRSNKELAEITKLILRNTDAEICGYDGTGLPEISADDISFNGCEEAGEDCETFYICNHRGIGFCKTCGYPYDTVVIAVLTAAIVIECPGWESISSDGRIEAWEDGITLFEKSVAGTKWDHKYTSILLRQLIQCMVGTSKIRFREPAWLYHKTENGLYRRDNKALLRLRKNFDLAIERDSFLQNCILEGLDFSQDHYDTSRFDQIDLKGLEHCIENGWITTESGYDDSPTVGDYLDFLQTHDSDYDDFTVFGYMVTPLRKDCRMVVEGLEGETTKTSTIIDFANKFHNADGFEIKENGYMSCWYD